MDKLRSVSVPRKHFYQNGYGNPITPDNQSPMNFNRGASTQDLHNNKSALINREVIKTEGNVDIRDDLYEKYNSLGSPYSNSRGTLYKQRPSGSWGEFILKQGEAAQAVNNNYRAEDKMRAMKYREALDMMIQEGKHKKIEMRNQSRQPTHDHVQLQELLKMEKARELEEKRHYNNELQRIQREKEELRKKEQLQREHELMEQRRLNEKMHEFDQIAHMQGKFVKQQTLNEYQAHINMKKQNMQLEKQREEIESPGPNQFFAKQDEERRKLYERIKDQANADRHKPIYFIEKEYQKFRQLEDFVNKSVQDKIEKDTLEMMRRNDVFKKAQLDALQNNRNQAIEKSMKQRADKRHEQEEFGMSVEQKKMVDHIEYLKREQDLNEKRNYYETLKNQAHERQEAKYRENAMTNAERILNFRRTKSPEGFVEDVGMNSLPMNARSHERSRQLKYIDNWLNNTAVNHQRMKQQ